MLYIDPPSDDPQKQKLIILLESSSFLIPWQEMINSLRYYAVVNCEMCAWDNVECDVKHTVSVSFWSSFRQDTERLLFLISSARNGSDSWCLCVCVCARAVTTELFPIDTVPLYQFSGHSPVQTLILAVAPVKIRCLVYSIPLCESLQALGLLGSSCRGRVSHLSR